MTMATSGNSGAYSTTTNTQGGWGRRLRVPLHRRLAGGDELRQAQGHDRR